MRMAIAGSDWEKSESPSQRVQQRQPPTSNALVKDGNVRSCTAGLLGNSGNVALWPTVAYPRPCINDVFCVPERPFFPIVAIQNRPLPGSGIAHLVEPVKS